MQDRRRKKKIRKIKHMIVVFSIYILMAVMLFCICAFGYKGLRWAKRKVVNHLNNENIEQQVETPVVLPEVETPIAEAPEEVSEGEVEEETPGEIIPGSEISDDGAEDENSGDADSDSSNSEEESQEDNEEPEESDDSGVKKAKLIKIKVKGYPKARAHLYAPNGKAKGLPLIVYIHGGGWISGSAEEVEGFVKKLSSRGFAIASIDYALAPDDPYPASTVQLVEVINYLYKNAKKYGYDGDNIFIAGNSSGAHLASQMGCIFTNENYAETVGVTPKVPSECIRGIILYNGVYNFDTAGDCHYPHYKDYIRAYTGTKNYESYERLDEMSTVKHITKKYPPVFITVGDDDPFAPQTSEFISKLEKKEIDYTKLLWDDKDLDHDYVLEQKTDEAKKALNKTVRFIKTHIAEE